MSHTSLSFTCTTRFLHAGMGFPGYFFLTEVLFFLKPWLNWIFSSWRFFVSASHTDPPIVGASDIGHGSHGPENM